jgi:hypothetical protein
MFVSDQAMLNVSFEVALVRLAALTGSDALTQVSADAYAAGTPSGMRLLVRSRFRDLITRCSPSDGRPAATTASRFPCSTPTSP